MTDKERESSQLPIWARDTAFPKAPEAWGWMDARKNLHPCDTSAALISAIREDSDAAVILAWVPGREHMILPEEVEGAGEAVLSSRKRRTADDLQGASDKLRWLGILPVALGLPIFYQKWSNVPHDTPLPERLLFALHAVINSPWFGVSLLVFLIAAFIPWYQARKRLRELENWSDVHTEALIPVLRFETWLDFQKAPVTRVLLVLITLVGLAQFLPSDSLAAAGLVKAKYAQGEWWRLLTAPFLHGNPIHFLMNASALLYLGKRLEVFARWPHLVMVFLFSAFVGGEASVRFVTATSVGASGGLMGWLGFLLVFESLHGTLVPRSARRRLLAGIVLTGVIGLIGYQFIDNAAHTGGLIAGMLYALIVFPKSPSPHRPNSTLTDRIAGGAALAALTFSAVFAVVKILAA